MEIGLRMSKLSEIHHKLREYGVGIEALSKLNINEAMEMLNYKRAKLKEHADGPIDEQEMDSQIEQAYERSTT